MSGGQVTHVAPRSKIPRVASTKIGASHATSKSGYAADIAPDIATTNMPGVPIPPASESGRQAGITPPSERQYTAQYDALSLEEVMLRTRQRERGELPPIVGGVTEPPKTRTKRASEPEPEPEPGQEFDSFAEPPQSRPGSRRSMPAGPEGTSMSPGPTGRSNGGCRGAAGVQTDDDMVDTGVDQDSFAPQPQQRRANPVAAPSKAESYLAQRKRITLELSDGTYRMSVVDVLVDRYGITILLPLSDEGGTFIPKPGSELKVVVGDKTYSCYFPGAVFEIEALRITGLPCIRSEED